MLHRLDCVVSMFTALQHQDSGTEEKGPRAVACVLASLTPAVPCASDAFSILNDLRRSTLQLQLCLNALRVVCMLSIVGVLTEQQKQGVVALLGGTPRPAGLGASSISKGHAPESSLFLLPEPASITQVRKRLAGLSLAGVFDWLLWMEIVKLPDPK
jgi:hypothetical protein